MSIHYVRSTLWIISSLLAGTAGCAKDNPTYCDDQQPCADQLVCAIDTNVCIDSAFAFDRSKFFDDGITLWSIDAQTTLTGTGADPSATVEARSAGIVIASTTANVDGTWSLALPAGTLTATATGFALQTSTADGTVQIAVNLGLDAVGPTIGVKPTSISDESHDVITFNSDGEPHHVHDNIPIALDSTHCAEVVKYGYLLDADVPLFGTENQRNALAWEITGNVGVALRNKDTRFRVVTSGGASVVDWQPLVATQTGKSIGARVSITRQLAAIFAKTDDNYVIEWEVVDWAGRSAKAAACWNMKILAAPLQTLPPKLATNGEMAMGNWRLTNVPPVSRIINGTGDGHFFESTITNGTVEPVEFEASVFAPKSKLNKISWIADRDIVYGPRMVDGVPCPPRSRAPECNPTLPAIDNFVPTSFDIVDATANLITWKVLLLDDNNQPIGNCINNLSNGSARCRIPGRDPAGGPVVVHLVAGISSMALLNPGVGLTAERSYQNFGYTGPASQFVTRCALSIISGTCFQIVTWQQHTMLRQVTLNVGSVSPLGTPAGAGFRFATAPDIGPTKSPSYSTFLVSSRPLVWDSGSR